MSKTTPRKAIDSVVFETWQAGIMHCLVTHCGVDSSEANKMVKAIAKKPSTLDALQRSARMRIMGAVLDAAVEEREQRDEGVDENAELQAALF